MKRRSFLIGIGATILNACYPSILKQNKTLITTKPQINYSINELLKIFKENKLIPTQNPIISNNSNAKTIILLEDRNHNKTANELLKKLLKIKKIIGGKPLVGLEGWTGFEIDKKRNKRYLNGNITLIENLLDNYSNEFELIGIENEKLQIELTNILIALFYYESYIIKTYKREKLTYSKIVWVYGIWDKKKALEKAKEIYKKYETKLKNYSNPEYILLGDTALKRDYYSVNFMLKNTSNLGVIVYGSYHTENIINHLKNKLGKNNFNLIIF